MSDALLCWCVDQLHNSFGLEASEEIVRYIVSIDDADEIVEYVGDLLQGTDGKKREFIDELLNRWRRSRRQATDNHDLSLVAKSKPGPDSFDIAKDSQKKAKRKGRDKQKVMTLNQGEPEVEIVKTPIDQRKVQQMNTASLSKKKSKFVSIYAKEGQDKLAIILPGRHVCECLAQKHSLINNCLCCGRIVCEQEGSGPCLFCGSLVCSKEEQQILQRDSNKSQKLRKKLMGECSDGDLLKHQEAGLQKAIQHKEKLLEYDKNCSKRTQILDDESDYFAVDSNQWLSPSEREKLRKKEEELRELRHTSRKDRKITLDFAGRQVIDEGVDLSHYYNKLDETIKAINMGAQPKPPLRPKDQDTRQNVRELVNPNIVQAAPEWVDVGPTGESHRQSQQKGVSSVVEDEAGAERSRLRLQDRELQEITDGGWCLSVQQPWASLLVRGIKRVEGQDWYTSHRGRLWIAAAAKEPTAREIEEAEGTYRHIYKKETTFPEEYPTGCLLGCVNVTDCLSQEQYGELLPDARMESASPFVFICSNPQELVVKFPLKGKHKIWKLDSRYHQGAKKGLVPSKTTLLQAGRLNE